MKMSKPTGLSVVDDEKDEAPQKRARGGRISGGKGKMNPGKHARGGAESNPYSAAGHVSGGTGSGTASGGDKHAYSSKP